MNLSNLDLKSVYVSRQVLENNKLYTFNRTLLNVYLSINSNDCLFNVFNTVGIPMGEFENAIKELFNQHLIYQVLNVSLMEPETLDGIKQVLAIHVGPLAPVIMSDAMNVIGIVENSIPASKSSLFIDEITKQIPPNKARQFRKTAEHIINSEG